MMTKTVTGTTKFGIPRLRQSPIDPEFVQNPYPFYAHARRFGDFFWWDDYRCICASTFRAVNSLLRDRRWGREIPEKFRQPVGRHLQPLMKFEANSMLEIDPPRHSRLRGLVLRAFTTRKIASLVPDINLLAEQLVKEFSGDRVDLLSAYGEKIPVIIIARLLGVPDSMADQLLAWSHDMVAVYQARRDRAIEIAASEAATDFMAYISELASERSRRPGNDLISKLVNVELEGGRLTDDELVSSCILLLNAGHEATVHTIGNGVKTLLDHGDAVSVNPEAICRAPGISATVEEILRFDPPLHMFDRYAKQNLELLGQPFSRGDRVALLLASANRDESVFGNESESFVPDRQRNRHVSFGAGVHFCLGAALAREELSAALQTLFSHFPRLRLAAAPRYANCYHFHGLESLPVTVE